MAAAQTLNATTTEQQFLELTTKALADLNAYKEANPEVDTSGYTIARNLNPTRGTLTITVSLPIVETVDADGGISFDAVEKTPAA